MAVRGREVEVTNRRAFHDYFIHERIECGIVLLGSEVKSIRNGGGNLRHGYAQFRNGELWLVGVNISKYDFSGSLGHEPTRARKLLLSRRELDKLRVKSEAKGFTLVPLRMYFSKGRVKVEIGLCQGKRQYDKRESIKERDQERAKRRGLD
ncbi:MAG: SsrA-binding protein SmpB [bacterium]|jgi:SsrA-binding protein